ncbi:hypothetical protein ACTU45_27380 [Streptomyces sp. 24-1644]
MQKCSHLPQGHGDTLPMELCLLCGHGLDETEASGSPPAVQSAFYVTYYS